MDKAKMRLSNLRHSSLENSRAIRSQMQSKNGMSYMGSTMGLASK